MDENINQDLQKELRREALIQKPYASDIAYHMILRVMVVTVVAFAGTALLTRTTMMEVLKEDYILTARA